MTDHIAQQEADRAEALATLVNLTEGDRLERLEHAVAELGRWARISAGPGVYAACPDLIALLVVHPEPDHTEFQDRARRVRELVRTHITKSS